MPQARLRIISGDRSLGLRISTDCTVSRVDGPAAESGLRRGDLITSINDVPVAGEQLMAVRLLQSRGKGPVIVEVSRDCARHGQPASARATADAAPAATKSAKRKHLATALTAGTAAPHKQTAPAAAAPPPAPTPTPAPALAPAPAPTPAATAKLSVFDHRGCVECYEAEMERREDVADGDSKKEAMNSLLSSSGGSKEAALVAAVGGGARDHQGYVARQLLRKGADVNAVVGGRNALAQAVDNQCPPMVRLLLEAGADHTKKIRRYGSSDSIFNRARLTEHQDNGCSIGYCRCAKGEVLKLLEDAEARRVRRGGTALPHDPGLEELVQQNEAEHMKHVQELRDEELEKQEYEERLRDEWRDAMIEEGKSFDEDDEDAWREYHSG